MPSTFADDARGSDDDGDDVPECRGGDEELRARDEFSEPKTEAKKREAASCLDVLREDLGTAAK